MLSGLRTLFTVLGFSIHNLFEGTAVGLEGSRRRVWQMFAAIIAHSAAVMFCIGTELVISGADLWRLMTYILMVSAVSPAGIIVANSPQPAPRSQVHATSGRWNIALRRIFRGPD